MDLSKLTSDSVELPQGELHSALINEDAAAEGQDVTCTIPSFDPLKATDPASWTPYVNEEGVFYPKRGDSATLGTPLDGPAEILKWRPQAGAEPDVSF